jgi:TRAP-type mannitol/chloroaromatic compound transport system permease small subunit
MNLARLIDLLRDRLGTVVRTSLVALAALVVLDAVPAVVDKARAHTAMEHVPAFWTVFGFLGCLLLVVFAKLLGRLGISAREDYYDD